MSLKDFRRKVVLIIGGAGDLGSHIAREFLERESKVCICDIATRRGKQLEEKLSKCYGRDEVLFCSCDVTNYQDLEDAYNECEKRMGSVNILINKAEVIKETSWKITMDVNYGGVVRGCELALKRMDKKNGGSGGYIINISNFAGLTRFSPLPFYSSSHAAVVHYTRCIGHECNYSSTGVLCHSLCPDTVDVDGFQNWRNLPGEEKYEELPSQMLRAISSSMQKAITEALFDLLREQRPGEAIAVEENRKPYYTSPSVIKY